MAQLITKESEVTSVFQLMVERFDTLQISSSECNIRLVANRIDFVRKKVLKNNFYSSWKFFFIEIGSIMLQAQKGYDLELDFKEFSKFLLHKHKLYGSEPFSDWREVGVLMRMGSKIARLLNIEADPDVDCKDEPFVDTFKDILGYCVLGYYMDRL